MAKNTVSNMTKAINFKPSSIDQSLIDSLQATNKYKSTADLLRAAIQLLAVSTLDDSVYKKSILNGYENDIKTYDLKQHH